jgi:hypothetical protein
MGEERKRRTTRPSLSLLSRFRLSKQSYGPGDYPQV